VKKAPQLRLSQIFKYPVGILAIWTEPFALARDLAGRIFMSTGKATLAHLDAQPAGLAYKNPEDQPR
jgi:hypothetical protein